MRNYKLTLGLLALAGSLTACDDYLSGPGLTEDPNQPSSATIDQVYHGMQVHNWGWHEGDVARHATMWMQQFAGTGLQMQSRDVYAIGEGDLSTRFSDIYIRGGLVDLRNIQQKARAANDNTYLGISRVWESWLIGEAASLWGDIPYSQAADTAAKPMLDEQAAVYARVQAVLDSAIVELQSGQGAGPGAVDLVYGGDRAKWIQVANTLKARFYMHWVEAQNYSGANHNGMSAGQLQQMAQTACGGNCVQAALAAAQKGLNTNANNFLARHANLTGEENYWYQFMSVYRAGNIGAGRFLVELLRGRNDPRLTQYFAPTASGQVVGAAPGTSTQSSQLSATRGAAAFNQPLIVHAENLLILAEAYYRQGNTAAALQNLNAARALVPLPALTGIEGNALLAEIMTEKYIALFQQAEVWNDFKRTCLPLISPAAGTEVIGRPLYGSAERAANSNLPVPAAQPTRNDNDPAACPRP